MTDTGPAALYEFDPAGAAPRRRVERPVLVVALEGWVDAGHGRLGGRSPTS